MARPWKMYVPFVVVGAIAFGGALLTASPTELEAQLQDLGSTLPETRHRAIDRLAKANAEMAGPQNSNPG